MKRNNYTRVPYATTIHGKEEIEAVTKVLKTSTQMGKNTIMFENKIANLFGHKFGVGTNSGSSSLLIAMNYLIYPKGVKLSHQY